MSYYQFAEMAVAVCGGLAFALVGWWEIVRADLERYLVTAEARDRSP